MALPARGELVIESSDEGHLLAQYNPLILACFTRQPRPSEIEALARLAEEGMQAKIRGGVLYVVARKDIRGGVDPNQRAAFESMMREHSAQAGPSAVVVLTEGFSGALARGVIAGLVQLSRRRKSLQVFATVNEACSWLAREHRLDAELLIQAYRDATKHLGDRALGAPG